MMKEIEVHVYEVHCATYVVEVEDESTENFHDWGVHEKAIQKVQKMIEVGEEPIEISYSHTLDPMEWTSDWNI